MHRRSLFSFLCYTHLISTSPLFRLREAVVPPRLLWCCWWPVARLSRLLSQRLQLPALALTSRLPLLLSLPSPSLPAWLLRLVGNLQGLSPVSRLCPWLALIPAVPRPCRALAALVCLRRLVSCHLPPPLRRRSLLRGAMWSPDIVQQLLRIPRSLALELLRFFLLFVYLNKS